MLHRESIGDSDSSSEELSICRRGGAYQEGLNLSIPISSHAVGLPTNDLGSCMALCQGGSTDADVTSSTAEVNSHALAPINNNVPSLARRQMNKNKRKASLENQTTSSFGSAPASSRLSVACASNALPMDGEESKENVIVTVDHVSPPLTRSVSIEFPPPPPRKTNGGSKRDGPLRAISGQGRKTGKPISTPSWNGEDVLEGLAFLDAAEEPGDANQTNSTPQYLTESQADFWESLFPVPDINANSQLPVESESPQIRDNIAAREAHHNVLKRACVTHRPVTRSMTKTRKVYVPIDNFTAKEERHLLYRNDEYVVGDYVDEYNCLATGRRMIVAQMDHCSFPKTFFWTQVMIASPDNLSAQVEYTKGCVCCLPKGEVDLPSHSELFDSDFTSDQDRFPPSLVEQLLEADSHWDDMTTEEMKSLEAADLTFRYSENLPFLQKYHDCHWLRDYKGEFGSSREWLGKEEIGQPNMARTNKPGDILSELIPVATWSRIVKETNRYARQKERKDWRPTSVAELKCWLGICMLMGIKKLPELAMYWNKSHPVFANSFISDLMARDRWLDIMGAIHLVNNQTITTDKEDPTYDRIIKVRWLVEELCERFRAVKPVDRFLSVDEMMVRCMAQMCPIKQYNKDKPTPHGMKVWALASATTRYVYALEVFCGAQSGPTQPLAARRAPVEKLPEDKATYKVVMGLMKFVQPSIGHVVTMDNYFTSVPLFVDLLAKRIFCTGTARPNIIGWPSSMLWHKRLKADRGNLRWRMHTSRELGSCVWQDKKPVAILSSYALPWSPNTTVQRKEGANKVEYPTSSSLLSYVKLMRGVDLVDQIRGGYSLSRRGLRWYKRLLFFILDSAICNAWVLGNEMWKGSEKHDWPYVNHLAFNIALADNLVFEWSSYIQESKCLTRTLMSGPAAHGPCRSATSSRKCEVCSCRTFWYCDVCKGTPAMCVTARPCYKTYHQRKRIAM